MSKGKGMGRKPFSLLNGTFPRRLALALALWTLLPAAAAQTPNAEDSARAGAANERLIQLQQQLEREERERLEQLRRAPRGTIIETEPAAVLSAPDECARIDHIELEGASLISEGDRTTLFQSFLGQCLGLGRINDLLAALTNFYVERGYVTARAYVPQQDTVTGVLHIVVIEGELESIELAPNSRGHINLATAFPMLIGKPVDLRAIEQGLDQLNRLQSNNVRIDIASGEKAGGSRLIVRNEARKRWFGNFSVDSTGQDSTGKFQSAISAGWDDPLRLNDFINVSFRHNLDGELDRSKSRAISTFYSIPFGYFTAAASFSDFEYRSIVAGQVIDFNTSGNTRTGNLKLDRVLFRDQTRKVMLSAGVTKKNTRNFIENELIATNSRDLTILDATLNISFIWRGALFSTDVGVSKGLKALGALVEPSGLAPEAPAAQFSKLNYSLYVTRPFALGPLTMVYMGSVNGQYTDDVLFGTEQFLIGGPFSVRGYRADSISGDTGVYARNELRFPVAASIFFPSLTWPGSIEPYTGFDIGKVFDHFEVPGGTLTGWTVGLALRLKAASFDFAYSAPAVYPRGFAGDDYFYARIALAF